MPGSTRTRTRKIPNVGPYDEAVQALAATSSSVLREAAMLRGIAVPKRASRKRIATLLVTHASRKQADVAYREIGIAFESREDTYPSIVKVLARHHAQRVLDIGCGPGLFAKTWRSSSAFPANATYVGVDVSSAAIDLANTVFDDDARFSFRVGDAERLPAFRGFHPDAVVVSFVVSYLSTHAVDRLLRTLAARHANAVAIVALSFLSAADRLPSVVPDEQQELRAACSYLSGNRGPAGRIWDLRRFESYRRTMDHTYDVVEQLIIRSAARVVWVGVPRRA